MSTLRGRVGVLVAVLSCAPAAALAEPVTAPAPSSDEIARWLDFADELYREREYYRAIGEYMRVAHFTPDPDLRYRVRLRMGNAWFWGEKVQEAFRAYHQLLNGPYFVVGGQPVTPSGEVVEEASFRILDCYLENDHVSTYFEESQRFLERWPHSRFADQVLRQRAVAYVKLGGLDAASETFARLATDHPASPYAATARELSREVLLGKDLPGRSRLLAATLSALVPGLGQVYAGSPIDGLSSLIYTGTAGGITALLLVTELRKDSGRNFVAAGIVGGLTAILYFANVYGAWGAASDFNQRAQDRFIDDVVDKSRVAGPTAGLPTAMLTFTREF